MPGFPSQPLAQHTPAKRRDERAHFHPSPGTPLDGGVNVGSLGGLGEQPEDIASLQREAALI